MRISLFRNLNLAMYAGLQPYRSLANRNWIRWATLLGVKETYLDLTNADESSLNLFQCYFTCEPY